MNSGQDRDSGDSGSTQVLRREMGFTHAEFFRLLEPACHGHAYRAVGPRVEIDVDGGLVAIELGPEARRKIALLVLPTTPVEISWDGMSRDRFEAFLARFDRAYQRGGG